MALADDAKNPGERPERPLRVLIVEDEKIPAEDLKESLLQKGYDVTGIAMTGEKAIASAWKDPPDLILMDIRLTGTMDGIETAERILKSRFVPVIYLTAFTDPALMERAKKTRPYGYLLKPYDLQELMITIEIAYYKYATDIRLQQALDELELRVQERTRELTKANEALEIANKKLALLNNITRHDIINQLLVLKSYIQLSQKYAGSPEKQEEFFKREQVAVDTIERQIAFTRDYQNLGASGAVWQKPAEHIARARAALPHKSVRVTTDCTDLEIYADPLLEKVFYNLLDNALKYGGEDLTSVRFTCQASENDLAMLVEDDGAGIAAGDREQLFTKGFGKHTGLGLFLSREILSITGISITETGEPGHGARFVITVPKGAYRFSGTG